VVHHRRLPDTSIIVQSVNGFQNVMVNGVLTPVSGGNPLNVTIAGVANTVTGVNVGTSTLTLGYHPGRRAG
jgi:hypothetical protein